MLEAASSGALDYVRLVECRLEGVSKTSVEIIVLDLDVERPQLVANDIRRVERVAIVFTLADDFCPEVLALRKDFPLVPHLNLRHVEFPRSLCLYDRSWEEVRTRWTAASFIERIRQWLSDTATGTLHRDDQPLEPLFLGLQYNLVIPAELVKVGGQPAQKLDVELVRTGEHRGSLIACKAQLPQQKGDSPKFIASFFVADARQHGVIKYAPRNLEELATFVRGESFDLIAELRERVKQWKNDGCMDAALIVVIAFPLQRGNELEPEINDLWAFLTSSSVFEVGNRLGVWEKIRIRNKDEIAFMMSADDTRRGGDIGLDVLRPQFSFSRESAAKASGLEADARKTLAVGLGSLGSQTVMNLMRSGFGTWTLIDEDDLMPHNLARHALPGWCLGSSKAPALAALIDSSIAEELPTRALVADILRPGDQKELVDAALKEAELILDFSASVPVARFLARHGGAVARTVSLFFNPLGTDLVCLGEDPARAMTLDCLEMQYYRAVIRDERLSGHLAANSSKNRYARSCRDVSFAVPTHLVSIHAGIAAHAVRSIAGSDRPAIKAWRCDPDQCEVSAIELPISEVHRATVDGWTLVIDDWLFQELQRLRSSKLPNETGGALEGAYDLPSRTIYVVDTIPSPPDSEEWPTLYIRGSEGLRGRVTEITEMTAAQIEYVGEWHSHPDGCPCLPSGDDLKVFSWMTEHMSAAGLPALMAIIGEHDASTWFIGKMEQDKGWARPQQRSN